MQELPTFDPGFSTPRMQEIFSSDNRVRSMLRVESALADAQAEHGLVPREAATAIAFACASLRIDAAELCAEGWQKGTVVVPLLDRVRAHLDEDSARWLHFGATTQDIVDTAMMLMVREGLNELVRTLEAIAVRARAIAVEHRATPAMARTFLQPALPSTFGVRAARWCAAIDAAAARLVEVRDALPVQLGGPIGDAVVRMKEGERVGETLASALGLSAAPFSWHADRSPILDVVSAVHRAVLACTKCAHDVLVLAQAEVGEVHARAGASTSMRDKQNPADVMRALAAAEAFMGVASIVLRASPPSLERGAGGWHAEQFAVPLAFHTASAVLAAMQDGFDGMSVDAARAAANIGARGAPIAGASLFVDAILAGEKKP